MDNLMKRSNGTSLLFKRPMVMGAPSSGGKKKHPVKAVLAGNTFYTISYCFHCFVTEVV